jgi:hypothetical protein
MRFCSRIILIFDHNVRNSRFNALNLRPMLFFKTLCQKLLAIFQVRGGFTKA